METLTFTPFVEHLVCAELAACWGRGSHRVVEESGRRSRRGTIANRRLTGRQRWVAGGQADGSGRQNRSCSSDGVGRGIGRRSRGRTVVARRWVTGGTANGGGWQNRSCSSNDVGRGIGRRSCGGTVVARRWVAGGAANNGGRRNRSSSAPACLAQRRRATEVRNRPTEGQRRARIGRWSPSMGPRFRLAAGRAQPSGAVGRGGEEPESAGGCTTWGLDSDRRQRERGHPEQRDEAAEDGRRRARTVARLDLLSAVVEGEGAGDGRLK
jgi:hypothetical protein